MLQTLGLGVAFSSLHWIEPDLDTQCSEGKLKKQKIKNERGFCRKMLKLNSLAFQMFPSYS